MSVYAAWHIFPGMHAQPPISARELRQRYREEESSSTRLQLLEDACRMLVEQDSPPAMLAGILGCAMRLLSVADGAVLFHESGVLSVQAAAGAVLPVGARVPAAGVLAAVLKAPLTPSIRQEVDSRLHLGQAPRLGLELLLPLAGRGSAVAGPAATAGGVLALLSPRALPVPGSADLAVLAAMTALLSTAQTLTIRRKSRLVSKEAATRIAALTPREQQVFALLPRGLSNAEMGNALGISAGTAKIHVERILQKLGVADRVQAAVRAAEWGLAR